MRFQAALRAPECGLPGSVAAGWPGPYAFSKTEKARPRDNGGAVPIPLAPPKGDATSRPSDKADGASPPQPEGQVHLSNRLGLVILYGKGGPARLEGCF